MRFRIKKTEVHNNGIRLRFYLGKDCFLTPHLNTTKLPFYRESKIPYRKVEYEIMVKKVFSWFWFRMSINLENVSAKLVPEYPLVEKFIMMLPPKINILEKSFKLNMSRDDKFRISYTCEEDSLFGEVSSMNFKEALGMAVESLKNTNNVRFLRSDYKTLYEEHFDIEVPHEKKFDPYYE